MPNPVVAGTCTAQGATPAIEANVDLSGALYRYSPAYVIPNFFDDEGEFNLVWNQDATLIVSGYAQLDGPRLRAPLPLAPLSAWYAGFGRLPEHTELALRVAAYDSAGRAVATSRLTWDCTTGAILRVEHRGNAAGAIPARLVEYYNAALDHYFVTADATELAALDGGHVQGWQRTGQAMGVAAAPYDAAVAVCRFYMPPAAGDSHFYSASPQECADVRARFPAFVLESDAVFAAALPDRTTGACATGTLPVYRLWNARADSNHRYTIDPAIRAAMLAHGYVAEGYGAEGVAFCALP
ncbi:MAG: hypothetical protein U1F54_01120 [Burkholderiales bacterium]